MKTITKKIEELPSKDENAAQNEIIYDVTSTYEVFGNAEGRITIESDAYANRVRRKDDESVGGKQLNTIQIVGDKWEVPAHERNELAIKSLGTFIDNGPGKAFTFREGGQDAFIDNGDRLTTESEDPRVVMAMMQQAASKGAENLESTGSDEFIDMAESAFSAVVVQQKEIQDRNQRAADDHIREEQRMMDVSPEDRERKRKTSDKAAVAPENKKNNTMSDEEAQVLQAAADQYDQADSQQMPDMPSASEREAGQNTSSQSKELREAKGVSVRPIVFKEITDSPSEEPTAKPSMSDHDAVAMTPQPKAKPTESTSAGFEPADKEADPKPEAPSKPTFEGETVDQIKARVARHNKLEETPEEFAQRRRAEMTNQQARAEDEPRKKEKQANELTGEIPAGDDPDESEQKRRASLARDSIKAYVVSGNEYRTRGDNPRLVFRDDGKTIRSRVDDEQSVKNQIGLMASRGVEAIQVKGTKTYRRNAWVAAQAHDIDVAGYQPTADDLRLFAKPENTMTDTTSEKQKEADRPAQSEAPSQSSAAKPSQAQSARSEKPALSGTLQAHGAAPYQHNTDKKMSYYVTVSDQSGKERTQWGVELPKAIDESGVQIGDQMTLRKVSAKAVTTTDENEKPVDALRANWVIDAPERARLIEQERRQDQGQVLKAVGRQVADRVPNKDDADAVNRMISEHVDRHQGPLPSVPVYEQERQAPVQRPDQEQEKQRQVQRAG